MSNPGPREVKEPAPPNRKPKLSKKGNELKKRIQNKKKIHFTKKQYERENPSSERGPLINAIRITKGKKTKSWADIKKIPPDTMVTIYRGVPHGIENIDAGDFIAVDEYIARTYAHDILRRQSYTTERGIPPTITGTRILNKKVKASEIRLHPDHAAHGVENEFLYVPQSPKLVYKKVIDRAKLRGEKNIK